MSEDEYDSNDDGVLSDREIEDAEAREEAIRQDHEEDVSMEQSSGEEPVYLPAFLQGVVARFGGLSEDHPRFNEFVDEAFKTEFFQRLNEVCNAVLDAMDALPPSPGRRSVSDSEHKKLRKQFMGVFDAYKSAKTLLKIGCFAVLRRSRGQKRYAWSGQISAYISSYPPYRKYDVLRSWLWRRTEAYRAWWQAYSARPEVKAKKAKNRPSKEAEAERKRIAYWTKQGLPVPPRPSIPAVGETPSEPSLVAAPTASVVEPTPSSRTNSSIQSYPINLRVLVDEHPTAYRGKPTRHDDR